MLGGADCEGMLGGAGVWPGGIGAVLLLISRSLAAPVAEVAASVSAAVVELWVGSAVDILPRSGSKGCGVKEGMEVG